MQNKLAPFAVTEAMVVAAESAYNTHQGSLEWMFHNRMRAALEAALDKVAHARYPELDSTMLTTLDTVVEHFETQGQRNVAQVLRLVRNRVALDAVQATISETGRPADTSSVRAP